MTLTSNKVYTGSIKSGISVVVPVFNSATILPQFVAALSPVLQNTGLPFELILVNDGSRDHSWSAIEQLAANYSWVRGISLRRNYGQHNALLAGIRAARYDITVTMDDDLQHPPEELPKLLAMLTDDLDVVYAPPTQERHGVLRDLASVITKLALQRAMGANSARMVSAWRVFRTDLRSAFESFQSPTVNIDVLLTWGTYRFGAIRLRHDARAAGASNYTIPKLVRHALNMMTGFSVLPLQLSSLLGFGIAVFGGGVLMYIIARYLITGSTVPGFPFLASIITIFAGSQLLALGIFGEYLAQMHTRSMAKPSYVVAIQTTLH